MATTPSRAMYFDVAYAPFGEQYAQKGTTDPLFTGQRQDTVSGLYDFLLREYSPSQGRWVSPDPAGIAAVAPEDPQSWNRYAYVVNDPTAFPDLLGLITVIRLTVTADYCQYFPSFCQWLYSIFLSQSCGSGFSPADCGLLGEGRAAHFLGIEEAKAREAARKAKKAAKKIVCAALPEGRTQA